MYADVYAGGTDSFEGVMHLDSFGGVLRIDTFKGVNACVCICTLHGYLLTVLVHYQLLRDRLKYKMAVIPLCR